MLCGYKINLQKSRVFSILIITKYNFFLNFKLSEYEKITECQPKKSAVCCCWLSHVQLFVTPQTVAPQAPLSMGSPRQE